VKRGNVVKKKLLFPVITVCFALYLAATLIGCSSARPVDRAEIADLIITSMIKSGALPSDFSYPKTPYFTDVPSTHWAFKFIQKMKDLGITGGCTTTTYCPDKPVTRDQMAVFIITSMVKSGALPSDFSYPKTPYFTDVPSTHWAFKFIQKMRELGIAEGCTSSTYCPDKPVTRTQMEGFLKKAFKI
jgi:hypothetical protein